MDDRMELESMLGEESVRRGSARQRGQTAVIVALMMVALLGFLALIVDVGNIYTQRRLVQRAADAGALAGARAKALNASTTQIRDAARDYTMVRNGAGACGTTILTGTVVVTAAKTFPTYFAGVIGVPTFRVSAVAEAGFGFPGSWHDPGLVPLAVYSECVRLDKSVVKIFVNCQANDPECSLVTDMSGPEGKIADGQRGWLNFNGGGTGDSVVDWVCYGYPDGVSIGRWINGEPGTTNSAMQAMHDCRLHQIIILPVYSATRPKQADSDGAGNTDYYIVGFAAFRVDEVHFAAMPKYIRGQFQRYVATEEPGGTIDTGVRVISLKR